MVKEKKKKKTRKHGTGNDTNKAECGSMPEERANKYKDIDLQVMDTEIQSAWFLSRIVLRFRISLLHINACLNAILSAAFTCSFYMLRMASTI